MQLHTTSTWVNPHESDFDLRLRHVREDAKARQRHYWLHSYNSDATRRLMDDLCSVLRVMYVVATETDEWYAKHRYPHVNLADALEHKWHYKLQSKFKMHPAVLAAVNQYRPKSAHTLVFEWPHVSETDPNRLAYTRDNRSGHEDRQTITTVGKYLTRHFPDMPDHAIRDLAARYAGFKFELWDTTSKIIHSVQEGPGSCMQWDSDEDHPYQVYDPRFGWRAAVRLNGHGQIVGRCLVYDDTQTERQRIGKIFVRSYAHKEGGYSHSDEGLEVWLREQGFSKSHTWEGCKLARIEHGWSVLAPYLDGDCKQVTDADTYLIINDSGRLLFDCTNGSHNTCGGRECDDCGNEHDEDDTTYVGRHEDHGVCPSCMDEYVLVYGRRGNQYYLHTDNAVYSDNTQEHYDPDYLTDNNMVELHDGDLVSQDDAVYLESRGEWWYADDNCVVHCEHDDRYEHVEDVVELADDTYADPDNTWECHVSGDRYHVFAHKRDRVMLSLLQPYADCQSDYVSVHVDHIEDFYANLDAITGSVNPILTAPTTI